MHPSPHRTATGPRVLAVTFLLACTSGCGDAPAEPVRSSELPPGFWFDEAFPSGAADLDLERREDLEALTGLGYASGYERAGSTLGVTHWDRERTRSGWNLYTSGHGPEAVLMDMAGQVVHSWNLPYDHVPGAPAMPDPNMGAWRRAALLPDGGLVAVHEGLGVVCVDRDSNLRWSHFGGEHHDVVARATDGHVFVLTQVEREVPSSGRTHSILDDALTELDGNGQVVRSVSLTDALMRSMWGSLLHEQPPGKRDLLHANSLELVDERLAATDPRIEPGQWLVCLRDLNAVATVDLDRERVTWLWQGPWGRPHDPTVVEDGRLLIFDNLGRKPGGSRVVEHEVFPEQLTWVWSATEEGLFSPVCGAVSRLADGNTLVTETCRGRAYEVTPDGGIVWSFVSPHRTGRDGRLVAALFEVVRIPERPPWLATPR